MPEVKHLKRHLPQFSTEMIPLGGTSKPRESHAGVLFAGGLLILEEF